MNLYYNCNIISQFNRVIFYRNLSIPPFSFQISRIYLFANVTHISTTLWQSQPRCSDLSARTSGSPFYHDPRKAVLDTRYWPLRGISPIILRYSCINSTNHLLWAVHLRNAFLRMVNLPRVSKIRSEIRFRRVITLIITRSVSFPYFSSPIFTIYRPIFFIFHLRHSHHHDYHYRIKLKLETTR